MGIAIVTGSSTGIGRAIALRLAQSHSIVVTSVQDVRGGHDTVSAIQGAGGAAVYVQADLSKDYGVLNLFRQCEAEFGAPTVLVNNAGATRGTDLGTWNESHWADMLSTNLVSTALMSQAFASRCHDGEGAIVNVASIRGIERYGRVGAAAYSAAKAGVITVTGALSRALAPKVLVNSISPGFTETAYMERADEALKDQWLKEIPIGRFIEPGEIADAVAFVLSCKAMTGSNIVIDGGFTQTSH